jgi:hypothetical protein
MLPKELSSWIAQATRWISLLMFNMGCAMTAVNVRPHRFATLDAREVRGRLAAAARLIAQTNCLANIDLPAVVHA